MKARILIIDDNVNLTTLLSRVLTKHGYEPVVQNDSVQAVETARRCEPDLILLDVMMPNLDGGDVLAVLRNDLQLRNVPVVLLTALAREASGLGNLGGIQSPVLGKPIQLGVLIDEIEAQLKRFSTAPNLPAQSA
ncbi:MAG: response regulator [Verrucomicrobiales bacterium]|nr:response regulator [Verrucomicrobiales bacterium]